MSTKIWYVRHGESEANLKGVFAGGSDNTPLTRLGKQQAKDAGAILKDKNIDTIICSPLSRTIDTATIIAKLIGINEDSIVQDERLIEYDTGLGNGTPYENATAQQLVSYPGAEDPGMFARRVTEALLDIQKMPGTVLVVAHGGVGRLIRCLEASGAPEDFYNYPKFPNADPVQLDLGWLQL